MFTLGKDIHHLGSRVQILEDERESSTSHLQTPARPRGHKDTKHYVHRRLNDLDNSLWRNNLRTEDLPEPSDNTKADLSTLLLSLFNILLGHPEDTPIKSDRTHKALGLKDSQCDNFLASPS
ncbi:Hypothetical predicted protein [Pelobates cultripes]|uniref:Uncharacterized protein n=1 Tax=Pelobates cultripes TaxID=61616 RepID=A0AAD1TKN7_PELCU|nr:Hypothetical predicted protein [Pelobates cultripes]